MVEIDGFVDLLQVLAQLGFQAQNLAEPNAVDDEDNAVRARSRSASPLSAGGCPLPPLKSPFPMPPKPPPSVASVRIHVRRCKPGSRLERNCVTVFPSTSTTFIADLLCRLHKPVLLITWRSFQLSERVNQ